MAVWIVSDSVTKSCTDVLEVIARPLSCSASLRRASISAARKAISFAWALLGLSVSTAPWPVTRMVWVAQAGTDEPEPNWLAAATGSGTSLR